MKNVNFDDWDDNIEITLFGETHSVRLGTFNDAMKVAEMQKEIEALDDDDPESISVTIGFLVERFKEAGADYKKEQFMGLAPAKVVAITRAITQGADANDPLDVKDS